FHVKDAAQNPILAMKLLGEEREATINVLKAEQENLRQQSGSATTIAEAKPFEIDWSAEKIVKPSFTGVRSIENISIADVRPYINWVHFFNLWQVTAGSDEAVKLRQEAEAMLDSLQSAHSLVARVGFFEAYADDKSIFLKHFEGCPCCGGVEKFTEIATPRQKKANADGVALSLCDFVASEGDYVGAFAVTISPSLCEELEHRKLCDLEESLMLQALCDRLVEAASEWLHEKVRKELWGYAPDEDLFVKELFQARYEGIRPAIGYPSLPNQRTIFPVARLLDISKIGISLTENGAMYPQSAVCGIDIANKNARYFVI
ncbi:MAG: hypothetical protein J6Q45_00340, partial [Alistipes sp.]|nr:hypothetical protein [Alistipes sp.]